MPYLGVYYTILDGIDWGTLTAKGRSELKEILEDPRFSADDAPQIEVLRVHPDLEPEKVAGIGSRKLQRSNRTSFIRNISARYRQTKKSAFPESDSTEPGENVQSVSDQIRAPEELNLDLEKPKAGLCSRLLTRIRKIFLDK